jgi:hypothetical protein
MARAHTPTRLIQANTHIITNREKVRRGYVQSTIDRQVFSNIQAPPVHLSLLLFLLVRLSGKMKCPRRQQSLRVNSGTIQSTIQVRQKLG